MSDYTRLEREQASDWMADYEGFGEMRSYTEGLEAEQVALTWRRMPPGTGGRGSYGHSHRTQEELVLVLAGTVTFKVGDEIFAGRPRGRCPPRAAGGALDPQRRGRGGGTRARVGAQRRRRGRGRDARGLLARLIRTQGGPVAPHVPGPHSV